MLKGRNSVTLTSEHRNIDIGFTALSYQDPGSVQLAYRMLGFQDNWRQLDPGSSRAAFFTKLPPGDLHSQVRGSNNADVWSNSPAELTIHIAPRWYETILARVLGVAALLLFVISALYLNYPTNEAA